jgi:predicted nuclease of predicted toxin-antitoxin system
VKILLDSCVWGGAAKPITDAGHEVDWVGHWDGDPGDEAILNRAHSAGTVLVTLDKDFGELAIVRGAPHAGIVRVVGLAARAQGPAVVEVLGTYQAELKAGAIVTVYATRVRIRRGEG